MLVPVASSLHVRGRQILGSISTMVVAARLHWIRQQVAHGSPAYISFGAAAESSRGKCKVIVDTVGAPTSAIARCLILDALSALERRAALASTMDRGHRHSGGKSEIVFWFSEAPKAADVVVDTVDPPPRRPPSPALARVRSPPELKWTTLAEPAPRIVAEARVAPPPGAPSQEAAEVSRPPPARPVAAILADLETQAAAQVSATLVPDPPPPGHVGPWGATWRQLLRGAMRFTCQFHRRRRCTKPAEQVLLMLVARLT